MFSKLFLGIYWLLSHNLHKPLQELDVSILKEKGFSDSEILAVISYIAEKNMGRDNIWNATPPRSFNEPEVQHISREARIALQIFQRANILTDQELEELIENLMEENSPHSNMNFHHKVNLETVCKLAYLMFVQTGSPYKKDGEIPTFTGKEKIC
ncbi:MAG: DUF494 family protein [Bacteroidia bacterium]|nr:DUF494 family protein [Bacteroidia bacterium]